jgi:hypothetical protein
MIAAAVKEKSRLNRDVEHHTGEATVDRYSHARSSQLERMEYVVQPGQFATCSQIGRMPGQLVLRSGKCLVES